MKEINKIKKLSGWIFFIPIVVLNLCLFISVNYSLFDNTIFAVDPIGRIGFTIPYIDGGVSISRTARTFPTYFLFKPGMIITAILLIKYWIYNNNVILRIDNEHQKNKYFLFFGIASAVFLILHAIFLGIKFEHDLYKFFRRFVIFSFIIFELVAQTMLVINIYKIKKKIPELINERILTIKIILVSVLIISALCSLPFLVTSGHTHFKHALEWNYFVAIVSFYLLSFLFWRRSKT